MHRRRPYAAFTLMELLVVIGIIAILAAIIGPVVSNFRKGDAMLSGTRQLLDAVARARQLAISQRTTVYLVFVPTNFWNSAAYTSLPPRQQTIASNVLDKQLTGYTFVTLRSVGDQPGRISPHYLSRWQTLPESIFIADWKFSLASNATNLVTDPDTSQQYPVSGFLVTNNIPFPSDETAYLSPPIPYIPLPYVAFNYLGQLTAGDGEPLGRDEYIPLVHGSILYARNPTTRALQMSPPIYQEIPANSSVVSFNLVHIDWLTGRARVERREIR